MSSCRDSGYLRLTDTFSGNIVNRTYSIGDGKLKPQSGYYPYTFSVYKDSVGGWLLVMILSPVLRHILLQWKKWFPTDHIEPYTLSLPDIARGYDSLKLLLMQLEDPIIKAELRLLINGFLLNRSLLTADEMRLFQRELDGYQAPWQRAPPDGKLESVIASWPVTPNEKLDSVRAFWSDIRFSQTLDDLRTIRCAFQKQHRNFTNGDDRELSGSFGYRCDNVFKDIDLNKVDLGSRWQGLLDGTIKSLPIPFVKRYLAAKLVPCKHSQIPHWSEGWGSPTDVGDCLILDLGSLSNITLAEQYFLYSLAWYSDLDRMKGLLRISKIPAAEAEDRVLIFTEWSERQLSVSDMSLQPEFRSIRRLTNCEKRDLIVDRLHQAFKAQDQIFREKTRNINFHKQTNGQNRAAFATADPCGFVQQRYHKAWDKGIATIRRLLQGKRPNTLEQICRTLQVAYAMGSQDPSNPDFLTSFVKDLDRWRTIVPAHSLVWFDAIAEAVWGKTFEEVESNGSLEYGSDETLFEIQQLLSSLISRCPLFNIDDKDEQQDPETSGDESRSECAIDISYAAVQNEVREMEDPRAYPDIRRLPICWEPVHPIIILVMAGAIFGFVFSFLLCKFSLPIKAPTRISFTCVCCCH